MPGIVLVREFASDAGGGGLKNGRNVLVCGGNLEGEKVLK